MSEHDFNKLFASNLTEYLRKSDHTQADLAKYVGVSTASVSNWCKGIKLPRMDKVDKICSFFQIRRSDLMELPARNPAADPLPSATLRPDESALLDHYNLLNDVGKEKAQEYLEDLTENKKYTMDEYEKEEQNFA